MTNLMAFFLVALVTTAGRVAREAKTLRQVRFELLETLD